MKMRTEKELCITASLLLRDMTNIRWSKHHLEILFSLGLTILGIERGESYEEHVANRLLIFVVKHALNEAENLMPNEQN